MLMDDVDCYHILTALDIEIDVRNKLVPQLRASPLQSAKASPLRLHFSGVPKEETLSVVAREKVTKHRGSVGRLKRPPLELRRKVLSRRPETSGGKPSSEDSEKRGAKQVAVKRIPSKKQQERRPRFAKRFPRKVLYRASPGW